MLKAVIFDLDGTLANTISAIREGINATMRRYGYPEHTDEEVLSFINNGARMLIKRSMPAEVRRDEALVSRVLADYDVEYGKVYHHTDTTYPGIPQLLCDLRARGLRIGVLSNKQDPFVRALAEQLIPGLYDVAQGAIYGEPTKPHPYLSNRVCDALGVSAAECAMVGDSDVDVRTAEEAGMTHVGVSWGFRSAELLREAGAVRIANDTVELFEILTSL